VSNVGTLIVGCGYTGKLLAQQLAFEGQAVYGTARSESGANVIRTRGAHAVVMEAPDFRAIDKMKGKVDTLVTMMPPKMERDASYVDHTGALMAHVSRWNLKAFVYVSSTSVYGDKQGEVVDESTLCTPDSPRGRARLEIEEQVLKSGMPAMVVRPAGIYGRFRSQFDRLAGRRTRLVEGGVSYTNRIHVRDLATIIQAACERGDAGSIYLASDERPALQVEVARHIVDTYGLPAPDEISLAEAKVRMSKDVLAMIMGSKRLDASSTYARLGVRLRFPDYVAGLAEIWRFDEATIRAAFTAEPSPH